ncbi:hypothetical protein [Bradyrhizobium sp. CCBAU 45389]|uniref:hypothetical protein n=1 Tax=Bradyrhizobium sp. CCBAU 45389 TaxID=858429 RepID=UPI002305FB4C|nr:hypothetical protein [Bradyrhizobium sp. CCBAU 45389]MDA9398600.1 hypothetical protein [Bradyrhizobium sp. CCBAU 45389]
MEQIFADQKAEYQDTKNDLKVEIEAAGYGFSFEDVKAAVDQRMRDVEQLDNEVAAQLTITGRAYSND